MWKEKQEQELLSEPRALGQGRTRSLLEAAGKCESYLYMGLMWRGLQAAQPEREEWNGKQGTDSQSCVPGLGLPLR